MVRYNALWAVVGAVGVMGAALWYATAVPGWSEKLLGAIPVLALNGEKDTQVPAAENLGPVEDALREGGNRDVTAEVLPGLNHLFQTAETGSPTEYAGIEETMSPAALEIIGDWVAQRTRIE